jgi:hypothetical protein
LFELLELHPCRYWEREDISNFLINTSKFIQVLSLTKGINFILVMTVFDDKSNPKYFSHATCIRFNKDKGKWLDLDANEVEPTDLSNEQQVKDKLKNVLNMKLYT